MAAISENRSRGKITDVRPGDCQQLIQSTSSQQQQLHQLQQQHISVSSVSLDCLDGQQTYETPISKKMSHVLIGQGRHDVDSNTRDPINKDKPPSSSSSSNSSQQQRFCTVFVDNLPNNISEEKLRKLFTKYGSITELVIQKGVNVSYACVKMDSQAAVERAKQALDQVEYEGKQLKLRLPTNVAAIRVKNLSPLVTNQLLEYAFSYFGELVRAFVITDEHGKSTGEGIVEFTSKSAAQAALKKCSQECFLLTAIPTPVDVEPFDQNDDPSNVNININSSTELHVPLPHHSSNSNNNPIVNGNSNSAYQGKVPTTTANPYQRKDFEFPVPKDVGPRFAQPGTFEYDFAMRWNHLSGNTALHEAAWNGYSQAIETLAKHKVNLNIKNKNGNTALHLACQQGHNQSCRNLLIYGAKPDIKNNYGDTPLHTAARYGHAGVVRILISAFCNVNEVNKNGDTALHISAAMGRRKLTRILLETGCNPAIKNKQGETAMDIALRKNFKEVQEIIAAIPVKDPPQVKRQKHKSESLPSQGSRQSREKRHKTKSSSKDHHKIPYHSPYGCPMSPDSKDFPQPRINSLPAEPLRKGEQYYIDLAGNIRKGPVGKVYNCYCVPLIEKVEKKLEKEKKELKEEIENCKSNLNNKISSLERKTNFQMVSLNETVKSRLSTERLQCIERNQKTSLKQRLDFERSQLQQAEQLKNQMKCWLESRLNQPTVNHNRKYQPNPARHKNNNYHQNDSGLTSSGRTHESINNIRDYVAYDRTAEEEANTLTGGGYDRPKSCLGYNKDFVTSMGNTLGYINNGLRSKSETHLAIGQGETIGTFDNTQVPGCSGHTRVHHNGVHCIGTTQAEVYYDGAHSCSEDSDEEEEEENITSHNNSNNTNESVEQPFNTNTNTNMATSNNNSNTSSTNPCNNVKNIYDLPTSGGHRKASIETEISQPAQVTCTSSNNIINNNGVKGKPLQSLPSVQSSTSHCPPEAHDHDHSGDLMKSLRCNAVPRGDTEYRNSPFSDSGFRSKYSPSPREGPLTEAGPGYPESKLTRDFYPTASAVVSNDPSMVQLQPPPSIRQLSDRPFRREPVPTRLNMATPASSLV